MLMLQLTDYSSEYPEIRMTAEKLHTFINADRELTLEEFLALGEAYWKALLKLSAAFKTNYATTMQAVFRISSLQESHLIPAAVYKRFYSPSHPNPNPMLISSRGVIQTSRQTKTHLLCNECEDVLNRNGEKWVLPRIANVDKSFPLFDMLTKVSPDCVSCSNISAYSASRNQENKRRSPNTFCYGHFLEGVCSSLAGQR